ncbi:MAG: hypothetical protein ACREJP_01140 [Candidatus Methylomirabilales bacterium]
MRKIPTIFVRDWENNPRYVTREPTKGCEWVFAGEGVASRKYDGTCMMFDGKRWWARREVKAGKPTPPGFVVLETDEETGKTVGWEPAEQSAFAKWLGQAVRDGLLPGTFELVGPKINGNPERLERHTLIRHSEAERYSDAPRDHEGLGAFLANSEIEGLVFHHPDGRMAKIKKRDFPGPPR